MCAHNSLWLVCVRARHILTETKQEAALRFRRHYPFWDKLLINLALSLYIIYQGNAAKFSRDRRCRYMREPTEIPFLCPAASPQTHISLPPPPLSIIQLVYNSLLSECKAGARMVYWTCVRRMYTICFRQSLAPLNRKPVSAGFIFYLFTLKTRRLPIVLSVI